MPRVWPLKDKNKEQNKHWRKCPPLLGSREAFWGHLAEACPPLCFLSLRLSRSPQRGGVPSRQRPGLGGPTYSLCQHFLHGQALTWDPPSWGPSCSQPCSSPSLSQGGHGWVQELLPSALPPRPDHGPRPAPASPGSSRSSTVEPRPMLSIHNGVIAVFQRKGLPDQELFSLNEGVRQLLKTELGSFFTEYLQNQLLTKGMVILRDKIRFYEEAAGLPGRDLGLLLQRRAAHTAGRLLPGAGQRAVRAPAGTAALPECHHPQREAGRRSGPHPRPRAPCGCADAVGAAGRARVPGSDQGLPAPRGADPEGGVALPGHLRPLLQRGEALTAPLTLRGRPGQEPGGALQELQHAAAEPRGGARSRGRGGRQHGHPATLRL
ncbi:proline-rich protein 5 isoform X6 [Sus scrofa]|uniref:proline-rich protein 5 isoform X6 n=1 Tax=Sus scrofa TaxID=9823 RepID=UPI000A2B2F41|nr:proline-rich protein 5 isoform X6 [Sus scrofa]